MIYGIPHKLIFHALDLNHQQYAKFLYFAVTSDYGVKKWLFSIIKLPFDTVSHQPRLNLVILANYYLK